ncbi:MAG: FG-GAP repeat protein, partial [Anaerolineales bacterium]|nr:FG-GAP repeat protein [Anaerolineales bacterium]
RPGRLWHQDLTDMNGAVDTSDRFGFSLAAADFDNDGYADLAVGVPGDDYVLGTAATGAAHVIYGASGGLTTTGNALFYHPDLATDDLFGAALTTADFNGDGAADLAVGAPLDAPAGANSGSVVTFYGNQSVGLVLTTSETWYPGTNGLQGTAVADDYFGEALSGSPRR